VGRFPAELYDSAVGSGIRESSVLFPWIESIHVLMATTVVGSIAIVDLRLIGYASTAGARSSSSSIFCRSPGRLRARGHNRFVAVQLQCAELRRQWPFVSKMVVLLLAGINMASFT